MDAVIGTVKSSFGESVRKLKTGMLNGSMSPNKKTAHSSGYENKPSASKVFGVSLIELCHREKSNVPYIVHDICQFIQEEHLQSEGIFRLSAPSSQVRRLRECFEQYYRRNTSSLRHNSTDQSVTRSAGVDGNVAATVLKQYLRHLPTALILSEILKISNELKCSADETFAERVRSCMNDWPASHRCTLQYIITFLQSVMRNAQNRMNVTGLSVVFAPNTFYIPTGIEGLETQAIANYTFERLLLTAEIICSKDDQGYLNMTSDASKPIRIPQRVAPTPPPLRPLPPPPVPSHNKGPTPTQSLHPSIPAREGSLLPRNQRPRDDIDSDETSLSCENLSTGNNSFNDAEVEMSVNPQHKLLVDDTIKHVIRNRLFSSTSSTDGGLHHSESSDALCSSSSDDDDEGGGVLLPSVTAGRPNGPKNRTKPSRRERRSRSSSDEADLPPPETDLTILIHHDSPSTTQRSPRTTSDRSNNTATRLMPPSDQSKLPSTVTTPDSGCLTMEEDNQSNGIIIPKLQLDSDGDDVINFVVPPLDLSEVTSADEMPTVTTVTTATMDTLHVHVVDSNGGSGEGRKVTPSKARRRRRRATSPASNHHQSNNSRSEAISIPGAKNNISCEDKMPEAEVEQCASLRWRDAWSIGNNEQDSSAFSSSFGDHFIPNKYYSDVSNINMDVAPSSPTERYHHHHHSYHHHHHSNNNNRSPKAAKITEDELDEIRESLSSMLQSLHVHRKEFNRPEDLTLMTRDEIRAEKVAMQRELLKFEGMHGRPNTREEKELMRHVYDRYRTVKRLLVDTLTPPITSALGRRFDDVVRDDVDVLQVTQLPPDSPSTVEDMPVHIHEINKNNHVSPDLGVDELRKEQKQAKMKRKRLRRRLKDFEKEFEEQYHRKVVQTDRIVMATEYAEYRDLKHKLRLLEALIEKHSKCSP